MEAYTEILVSAPQLLFGRRQQGGEVSENEFARVSSGGSDFYIEERFFFIFKKN